MPETQALMIQKRGGLTGRYLLLAGTSLSCCIGLCVFLFSPALPQVDKIYRPRWSADGQYIAFECVFYTWDDLLESLDDPGPENNYHLRDICVTAGTKGPVRRLTQKRYMHAPAWSPNGRLLAWLSGDRAITIWNAANDQFSDFSSEETLAFHDFGGDHLAWSQDNTTVYLQGAGVRLNIITGQLQYLPEPQDGLDTCCYTWSPDGSLLAFKQDQGRDAKFNPHYRILIYSDGNLVSKSQLETTYYDLLSWSPDGKVLAWVSSSTSWGLFGDQLSFTYTLTGETMTLQLKDARTVQYPSWSPDGRRLAYSSFDGVHILTLQRQVSPFSYTVIDSLILETGGFYSDSPLAWAPDRQKLAFGTQDSRVLIVTLDGSRYFLGDH